MTQYTGKNGFLIKIEIENKVTTRYFANFAKEKVTEYVTLSSR
jgi:hypothetical protein